jgi:N-acetylglucosamine-6-phosphate deacetylase
VRLHDGTLAGSAASLLGCLRHLVAHTGCSVEDALATATTTPLSLLGLPAREERIELTDDLELC